MKLIDQSQSPLNILEQVGQDHDGPIKGYVHSVESFGSVDGLVFASLSLCKGVACVASIVTTLTPGTLGLVKK